MSTEPVPDIDGMGPPRAVVPDEHVALMFLRRIVAGWGVLGLNDHEIVISGIAFDPSPAELDLLRRLTEEAEQ